MGEDWRVPYRSQDAGGSPESARAVAWAWIDSLAASYGPEEMPHISQDGTSIALYRGTELRALTMIFRDPMNFAVLVRWKADDALTTKDHSDAD